MSEFQVLTVTDFGTIEAEMERLEKMKNATKYMSPVMKRIMLDMARATGERIKSKGRRGGGSWKRLADATEKKKGNDELLYTVGVNAGYHEYPANTLVRSVTNKGKTAFSIRFFDEHSITFGTNRPYAGTHQDGNTARNIPKRDFLRFEEYDEKRWAGWITEYLTRPYRTTGKKFK